MSFEKQENNIQESDLERGYQQQNSNEEILKKVKKN